AEEYFDEPVVDLLNQARKYKVGLTFAHQNLDQLSPKLKGTIMANTSIKLTGGVSFKDAHELAREMRCDSDILLTAKKRHDTTEFACFVKNLTPPLTVTVPLGFLERLPRMDEDDYETLIDRNRERYCAAWEETSTVVERPTQPQDPKSRGRATTESDGTRRNREVTNTARSHARKRSYPHRFCTGRDTGDTRTYATENI
ncbi:MAG: hypothetical protein ACREBU_20060, partial [Nitrososphaera sp.]